VSQIGRERIIQDLVRASARFSGKLLGDAADSIWTMEAGMMAGGERDHLRDLIRKCRYRGTDVDFAVSGEEVPYPAYVWYWRIAQSYSWQVAVFSRGRSSSPRLNRLCRRYCALACASDISVHCVWTISGWNFADKPSRGVRVVRSDG
jgi:hypothetical protein